LHISTLSLHDALPIWIAGGAGAKPNSRAKLPGRGSAITCSSVAASMDPFLRPPTPARSPCSTKATPRTADWSTDVNVVRSVAARSEEHTSELPSLTHL